MREEQGNDKDEIQGSFTAFRMTAVNTFGTAIVGVFGMTAMIGRYGRW